MRPEQPAADRIPARAARNFSSWRRRSRPRKKVKPLGTKLPSRRFDATGPTPAVHNGACRGTAKGGGRRAGLQLVELSAPPTDGRPARPDPCHVGIGDYCRRARGGRAVSHRKARANTDPRCATRRDSNVFGAVIHRFRRRPLAVGSTVALRAPLTVGGRWQPAYAPVARRAVPAIPAGTFPVFLNFSFGRIRRPGGQR